MFKIFFSHIKNLARQIYDAPGLYYIYKNAYIGWPNSQYELANYYLSEKEDYLEAYAWADVACCQGIKEAIVIKQKAESKLQPEQIKLAWEKAREYRHNFILT